MRTTGWEPLDLCVHLYNNLCYVYLNGHLNRVYRILLSNFHLKNII